MTLYITIGNILKPLLNMENGNPSRKSHSIVSLILKVKIVRQKKLSYNGHG